MAREGLNSFGLSVRPLLWRFQLVLSTFSFECLIIEIENFDVKINPFILGVNAPW